MAREAAFARARETGDLAYDGCFFAAVVTTRIYCRVVCPAPAPKLSNVRVYASAAAAQAAGFRPCRRCHPERAADIPAWSDHPPVLGRALTLIAEGALDDGNIETLAARLGVGARHLRRLFVEHLGAPPVAIAKARRVDFARRLLDETSMSMADIAFASGFGSVRQFNHDLRGTFGRSPTEMRRVRVTRRDDDGITLRLPYRPPLDWPRMISFLRARAIPGAEVVEHDRYLRTIEVDGAPGLLELSTVRDQPYLQARLVVPGRPKLTGIVERARRLFDLNADPVSIRTHFRRDPVIGPMMRAKGGLRVPGTWDPFEVAVRAVLGQQISVRAATTIAGRVVQLLGKPVEGWDVSRLFPTADAVADADLRSLGMTTRQASTIRSLAERLADRSLTLDLAQGLEPLVEQLTTIPGIGPWTAHYIAMRLGDPDAFPAGDLGLRNATGKSERELARAAEAWRPWRAYAVMYLWSSSGATRRGKDG